MTVGELKDLFNILSEYDVSQLNIKMNDKPYYKPDDVICWIEVNVNNEEHEEESNER